MKKIPVSLLLLVSLLLGVVSARANTPHGSHLMVGAQPVGVKSPSLSPNLPQITIIDFGGLLGAVYNPADIFIAPGDQVSWQGDFTMHPLVSDDALWTTVSSGSQFDFTFQTLGVYHYHCLIHGAFGMSGKVTVGYRIFVPEISS